MARLPEPLGIIGDERLQLIPRRHRSQHEFCFHIHDLMLQLLHQIEGRSLHLVNISLDSEVGQAALNDDMDIMRLLEKHDRHDLAKRVIVNSTMVALYADMLHFLYEGLRALEKRKFTIAFSLFRKPLKEGILIVAQMCADEDSFYERFRNDASSLLDRTQKEESAVKSTFSQAIDRCRGANFVDADNVYGALFDRGMTGGLAGLFDLSTHYLTDYKKIRTNNSDINLIFHDPMDDAIYRGTVYPLLGQMLLFLHIMQVELYDRMTEARPHYRDWLLFSSLGAYEGLFMNGRGAMREFVNEDLKSFLECPVCRTPFRLRKENAARFFISEYIDCVECEMAHHFPIGWLISKMNLNIARPRSE